MIYSQTCIYIYIRIPRRFEVEASGFGAKKKRKREREKEKEEGIRGKRSPRSRNIVYLPLGLLRAVTEAFRFSWNAAPWLQ